MGTHALQKLHHGRLSPKVIATKAYELLTSVSARKHVSDTQFVVESVSTPQPQALNQNPSI